MDIVGKTSDGKQPNKSPIEMKDNSIATMFGEVNLCISTTTPSKKWGVFHIMVCVFELK